jgi:hypothetical protein
VLVYVEPGAGDEVVPSVLWAKDIHLGRCMHLVESRVWDNYGYIMVRLVK